MITKEELIERYSNANRLYQDVIDLASRKTKFDLLLDQLIAYGISLSKRRKDCSVSSGVNIAWYDSLNNGIAIAYDEFDYLIDSVIQSKYDEFKETVRSDIIKVKAICAELSYIEPYLIKFDETNYKIMDRYLKEYNACPFCNYISYDRSAYPDENFLEYLNRVRDDLVRAIAVLPALFDHMDNVRIILGR